MDRELLPVLLWTFLYAKLIPKYQTGKDILPIDWRPRSELDSKYNLGSKSYDKTGQVSGQ